MFPFNDVIMLLWNTIPKLSSALLTFSEYIHMATSFSIFVNDVMHSSCAHYSGVIQIKTYAFAGDTFLQANGDEVQQL